MSGYRSSLRRIAMVCSGIAFLVLGSPHQAVAQVSPSRSLPSPSGEGAGKFCTDDDKFRVSAWEKSFFITSVTSSYDISGYTVLSWTPPKDRYIITANFKKNDKLTIFVLLDDGSVYETTFSASNWSIPSYRTKADPSGSYQAYVDIVGDALYVLSNTSVYVSRNSGSSFQVDTTGLGFSLNYGIALDSLQYAYLATYKGLYKQHPDSSIWRKIPSFPGTACLGVFVDRKNRLFASTYGGAYYSTNGGTSWTTNNAGLNSQDVDGFCDDAFGNVYARNGTHLWRSMSGTQAWTSIDQPLSSQMYDPSFTLSNKLFNGITGDSVLHAATAFGMYRSQDQGSTWKRDSSQANASLMYGFVKTPGGKFVTSTSLGVYNESISAQQWTKTFPSSGFISASPLFIDRAGTVYTLGSHINAADNSSVQSNWKSSDGGTTWNVDSAGVGKIQKGQNIIYFVDETGIQHFAGVDTPAKLYSKAAGQNWTVDTAGYGKSTDYPTIFGSDGRGNVYFATLVNYSYGMLYKRPVSGGSWSADTAGLGGAQIYSLTVDRSGNLIAGTLTGVYRKTNGLWKQLQYPQGLGGYNAFVVSVDSTGALLAGFSTLAGLNYSWRGVFATRDNGSTWTRLGLDSVSIRGLVSYGDSTFAWTYANGLYLLRSNGTASYAPASAIAREYALEQNYPNPFNPTTTIEFSIPRRDRVSLKVFDMMGREIVTLVDGEMEPGLHRSVLDASRLSSGVYFYRLRTSDISATKKIVLLK